MRHQDRDIEREIREGRLETAADLERAALMLPPDSVNAKAIDDFRRLSLSHDPGTSEQCALALEHLEHSAGESSMPREFWVLLKHSAVREALYYHAQRYKQREDAA
jgi:hypothetical protein